MTASKPLKPRDCRERIPNAAKAVMMPATKSGMAGNSRWMPIAAPMNSARSVAIAMTSAWIQSPNTASRGKRMRETSARFMPVAMPSFALID